MVPSGWKKAELGEYIVEHRKKSTTQDEYDVFTSSRKGLVLQSEYFSGSRLAARDNIGYNILPDNHITYRSRSDDGIFVFNINKTGSTGIISHFYPVFKIQNGDIGFFLELLNSYRRKIGAFSVGTSQTVLSMNALKKVKLNIPPLPEQKKIARILSTWDKAIETVDKLIENSQQQKKALMQQLLTGKKRLPGFSGEWKKVRLLEMANITMGSSPKSEAYNADQQGLPLIQGNADISNRKSNPRVYTSQITKTCKPNDILISVRAPVGEIAISQHEACIGRGIAAITPKKPFSHSFVFQQMLFLEPRWGKYSQGSTFEAINSKELRQVSINAPRDTNEQNAIGRILSIYDNEIEKLSLLQTQTVTEKQALMQQLLTGKRRVQVDGDRSPAQVG